MFFPKDAGKPFGWQDQAEWAAYGRWMFANKLIKATPDRGTALHQRVPAGPRAQVRLPDRRSGALRTSSTRYNSARGRRIPRRGSEEVRQQGSFRPRGLWLAGAPRRCRRPCRGGTRPTFRRRQARLRARHARRVRAPGGRGRGPRGRRGRPRAEQGRGRHEDSVGRAGRQPRVSAQLRGRPARALRAARVRPAAEPGAALGVPHPARVRAGRGVVAGQVDEPRAGDAQRRRRGVAVLRPGTLQGPPTQESGRVTALAVDPACHAGDCKLWVAAAGGGIWRTNDAIGGQAGLDPAARRPADQRVRLAVLRRRAPTPSTPAPASPTARATPRPALACSSRPTSAPSWTPGPRQRAGRDQPLGRRDRRRTPTNPDVIYIGTALARHGSRRSTAAAARRRAHRRSASTSRPTAARPSTG